MASLATRHFTPAARPQQTSLLVDDIEPTYREILFSAVVVLWFMMGMDLLPGWENTVNTIGLTAFSIVLGWAGYRQMKRNVASLWTPLLWYRVAMLSYFGIGSMVPIWVNDDTQQLMRGFYDFFGYEIVKLNAVITVFNLVFLIVAKLLCTAIKSRPGLSSYAERKIILPCNFNMIVFGTVCLAVGSFINYFIVFPQVVGWFSLTYFSTISNLAMLSWLGYFMVVYWGLSNNRPTFIVWPIILAFGEFIIGFFAMSKSVMLMPIVMICIAFIYHRRTFLRIAGFATAFVSLFMFLSPLITHVRNVNALYYAGAASPTDIPSIYLSYFDKGRENDPYAEVETGWMRLSFVNSGTFAINQYDHGTPGRSYRYWSVVWIPRIIYPNKPVITDVARELSYLADGNYDSSSSAGLAPEAYWNGGWLGTIAIAILISLVFTLWSIYSVVVIERKAWHLFFVVLLGMRMAIRVDGAFVSDILGPIALVFLAHVTLELMNRFLPQILASASRSAATALR